MYLKMLLGSSQYKGIQTATTMIHKVAATKGIPIKIEKNVPIGGALANRIHIISGMIKIAVVLSGSFHDSTAKEHIHQ